MSLLNVTTVEIELAVLIEPAVTIDPAVLISAGSISTSTSLTLKSVILFLFDLKKKVHV